jgi:RNA polymerase sigma-70 factor (ECF subfamily)
VEQTEAQTTNQALLREFFAAETESLLRTFRYYLARAGLSGNRGSSWKAVALMNEVAAEALEHADRFRPSGQVRAWVLGIAANLIKRKQAELARRNQREPLVQDLFTQSQAYLTEDELFDRLVTFSRAGLGQDLEALEGAAAMLARLSEADQQIVTLAVLHGMNGRELAATLGVKPGTARVRLHRALNRLRRAWPLDEQEEVGDDE